MSRAGPHGWACWCGEINVLTALSCVSCGDTRLRNVLPDPDASPPPLPRAAPDEPAGFGFLLAFGGAFALLLTLILAVASFPRHSSPAPAVPTLAPARYEPGMAGTSFAASSAAAEDTLGLPGAALPGEAAPPLDGGNAGLTAPAVSLPVAPPTLLYAPERAVPLPPLAVIWAAPPLPGEIPGRAEAVINHVAASMVLVFCKTPRAYQSGAGFVAGPNRILTCLHLVRDAQQLAARTADGRQVGVSVMRVDSANDLALLYSPDPLPPPLAMDAGAALPPGTEVGVTGFPQQEEWPGGPEVPVLTTLRGAYEGVVMHRSPGDGEVEVLQVQAGITKGFSGGPIYSLQNGAVLGLAIFRTAPRDAGSRTMAYAVPAAFLERFLAD